MAECEKCREECPTDKICPAATCSSFEKQLEDEIEHLRVQLAGCGVAAMANTLESRARLCVEKNSYGWSASYDDVFKAVGREIELREKLQKLLAETDNVTECFSPWIELIENTIKADTKCPNEFEEAFTDGNQLINVWFSSTHFLVVYMNSAGTTLYDQYELAVLQNWLNI